MNSKNVLILGAGVSGLTTALTLLRSGHKVTIWSKEPDGYLPATSANAYAMWVPVKSDADPRMERWANETFAQFESLSQDGATGVAMRQFFTLKMVYEEPWYAGKFAGFRHGRPDEIPQGYKDVHVLDAAPVIDPPVYLNWLRNQVLAAGGSFCQREVQQFADIPVEYSVIINSTAIGSRELAGDKEFSCKRIQVVNVKSKGFDKVVIDDEGPSKRAYVVPHADYIKLGAIFDTQIDSLEVDDQLTLDILDRCSRMVPELQVGLADVLSVTRVLRPERPSLRVEMEALSDGRSVVHNYGHGGGYILSYGIAAEIAGYLSTL